MRPALGTVAVGVALTLGGCGLLSGRVTLADCRAEHAERPGAVMPACVDTARGAMAVETEYLPGVVECEVGGFRKTPAAQEAQAIVARTYLLAHLTRVGFDAPVGLTARFQCWKSGASEAARRAVARTSGAVLHRHGDVLDANYASGTPKRAADCTPQSPAAAGYPDYPSWEAMRTAYQAARKAGGRLRLPGAGWTELLITRNEGRDGLAVEPTAFAPVRPTNRGAFGQWASACLAAKHGYDVPALLRHFFGDDVQIFREPGGDAAP